jgi:hypothetical protein
MRLQMLLLLESSESDPNERLSKLWLQLMMLQMLLLLSSSESDPNE